MTFSEALDLIKLNRYVHRTGWNGNGMFITQVYGKSSHFIFSGEGSPDSWKKVATDRPYLVLGFPSGEYQFGWIPSQADIFATDWEVLQ